ncbi:putative capsid protein [Giant house spider associated circular virus 3]|uniref:putative capsid protein n=1 Tax=Giant house spider associated circular virus 3 TaxID=2293290 RepID=UPI000E3366DD|nr:putative capsid protein [Giant house spider associated circular virus 3]AXL65936.1 putative capsid protein [Giant house spider associated circular virus 3]
MAAKLASAAWRNRKAISAAAAVPAAFFAGRKNTIKRKATSQGGRPAKKAKQAKRGTRRASSGINVEGTINTGKKIQYKNVKFNKSLQLQGGVYRKERYETGVLYHDPGDDIFTQKVKTIDFVFDGGPPVALGTNITSIFNDMYANQATTAPLYSSGAVVLNQNEALKFFLQSGSIDLELTNMSAGSAQLTIYVLMAKNTKSTTSGPTADWTNGLIAEKGSQANTPTPFTINNRPTSSKVFNVNWKVCDSKTYNAGPGAKVNYAFNFSPRSVVDATYFARHTQIRGLTYALLAVTHGQLGLTAAQAVVPKPVQWIYSIKKTYILKTVNNYPAIVSQYVQSSATVSASGPVTVREDDGELEV